LLAEKTKEPQQRLGRAIGLDPQQAFTACIDLIDDRLVFVPLFLLHFVHTDRLDSIQLAMR
jgi:hypothetical protein